MIKLSETYLILTEYADYWRSIPGKYCSSFNEAQNWIDKVGIHKPELIGDRKYKIVKVMDKGEMRNRPLKEGYNPPPNHNPPKPPPLPPISRKGD